MNAPKQASTAFTAAAEHANTLSGLGYGQGPMRLRASARGIYRMARDSARLHGLAAAVDRDGVSVCIVRVLPDGRERVTFGLVTTTTIAGDSE